jgi:eukaryotic-like serine/threonine-protein kinase
MAGRRANLLRSGQLAHGELGDYLIASEIGRGGTSIVYLATDQGSGRPFAAKVFSSHRFPASQIAIARFVREIEHQRQIVHPNVIRVHDVAQVNGQIVSILEYAPGGSLYERLKALRSSSTVVPMSRALEWMWQLLAGLSAIHEAGMIHRDISPKNIIFKDDGTLALYDFGTVRESRDIMITRTEDHFCSLIYISPEQRNDPMLLTLGLTSPPSDRFSMK